MTIWITVINILLYIDQFIEISIKNYNLLLDLSFGQDFVVRILAYFWLPLLVGIATQEPSLSSY